MSYTWNEGRARRLWKSCEQLLKELPMQKNENKRKIGWKERSRICGPLGGRWRGWFAGQLRPSVHTVTAIAAEVAVGNVDGTLTIQRSLS